MYSKRLGRGARPGLQTNVSIRAMYSKRLGRGAWPGLQKNVIVTVAITLLLVMQFKLHGYLAAETAHLVGQEEENAGLTPNPYPSLPSKNAMSEIRRMCPSPLEYRPDLLVHTQHSVSLSTLWISWLWRIKKSFDDKRQAGAKSTLSPQQRQQQQQRAYDAYKRHIDSKIASLPTHKNPCPVRKAFRQEFGYELQGVVPWYYDEHIRLKCDLYVHGMPGSRYLYYWSKNWTAEPNGHRTAGYLPAGNPLGSDLPHVQRLPDINWTMPPWKEFFAESEKREMGGMYPRPDLPLAVVFNKYTREGVGSVKSTGPTNFLDVESLRGILSILTPSYQVVYIRMESNRNLEDKYGNLPMGDFPPLSDKAMIRSEFPQTVLLDPDVYNEATMDYNLLLFGVVSRAGLFVSVQGGNSVVASLWGAPNFVYAVMGVEISRGGFLHGWYGKLSGSDVKDSLVTVYNHRDKLVEDLWRWVHCRRLRGNGMVEEYVPVQEQLFERAIQEKGFVP